MFNTLNVREEFVNLLTSGCFTIDKSGAKTLEIIGESFLADEPTIFGQVNYDYTIREIQWYETQSRNVNLIPGGAPKIWRDVATPDGRINSNYGWCIWSAENGHQFDRVLAELLSNPFSRRAEMIYTRPSMHTDYNTDGMSDFICTDAVQYFIRNNRLHAHVRMRSNDAIFGYRNDFAWQEFVLRRLLDCYNMNTCSSISAGDIIWTVGSLHVYERHFNLVKHFAETGEWDVSLTVGK